MALVLKDRVKETTTTTGTGSLSLLGQSIGYQAFSVIGNGNTCYYAISATTSNEWEVGIGTYSTTGPTLARTTILASSNSGSVVNLSAGTKDVYVVYPAGKAIYEEANGETLINGGPITVVGTGVTSIPSLPAELGKFIGNVNSFAQIYNLNQNDGSTASADFVAYNDETTDGYTHFTDMGINSSNYTSIDYPIFTPGAGYIYHDGDDFFIGNQTANKDIVLFAGGVQVSDEVIRISGTDRSVSMVLDLNVGNDLDVTGAASFGSTVLLNQDPTIALQAATKQYVDNQVTAGLHIHEPVRVETTANLTATYTQGGTTFNITDISGTDTVTTSTTHGLSVNDQIWLTTTAGNGLFTNTAYFVFSTPAANQLTLSLTFNGTQITGLTNASGLAYATRANSGVGATLTNAGAQSEIFVDGLFPDVGERIMVRLQTAAEQNGVYVVTVRGNLSTNWVLTRATDSNKVNPADPNGVGTGDYYFTREGDLNAGDSHVLTTEPNTMIIGYTPLTYTQFSGGVIYTGTAPINVTGQVISLTGTVAATNGGTGTNTVATGDLLYGSASDTWSKLPAGAAYKSLVMNAGGTNVEWNAVALNQSGAISGSLGATNGGTGQNSYALGDTLYSSATNTLAKLSGNTSTTKQYLSQTGTGSASAAPSWATLSAADIGSGTLPAVRGGTGQSSYAVGDLLYADTTTTLAKLADAATGNVLLSGGTNTAPLYGKVGLGTHISGVLAVSNGGTGLSTLLGSGAVLYADTTGSIGQNGDFTFNGSTLSAPNLQTYVDLTFFNTGLGNRIRGDMSNATVANRLSFQTSTVNGITDINAIPNGTGIQSQFSIHNNSDTTNCARGTYLINTTEASIRSNILGSGTYVPLTMWTGGSERLRITTSGDVGIGSSATNRLNLTYDSVGGGATIGPNSTSGSTFLTFGTSLSGTYGERMRINSAGDVLVGTTAAAYSLAGRGVIELNGSSDSLMAWKRANASLFYIHNNSGGIDVWNTANTFTRFGTNGAERMRIAAAGNVGIGATAASNPSTSLDVSGVAADPSLTANTGVFRIQTSTSNEVQIGTQPASPFGAWIQTKQTNNSGASFPLLLNPLGGDIGIGTASPSSIGANYTTLDIRGSAGGGIRFGVSASTNFQMYADAFSVAMFTGGAVPIIFFNNSTERMRLTAFGGLAFGSATAYGVQNAALISNGDAPPSWSQTASLGSFFYQNAFMGGF
jgi:hypothetical protein